MPITIIPTEKTDVTKLVCPACGEKVKGVGLKPNSRTQGFSFKCRRCGELWEVNSTPDLQQNKQQSQNPKR